MQISNLAVLVPPKSTTSGSAIIAQFDVDTGIVKIRGLAVVRMPSGQYRIWSRREGTTGRSAVEFTPTARSEILSDLFNAVPSLRVAA